MSKNPIEQLADHLRHTYSDAHIHIDPGMGKDAVWFLDVSRKDKDLNISWFSTEDRFGVSNVSDDQHVGDGEGPDASFSTLEEALRYVNDLLRT